MQCEKGDVHHVFPRKYLTKNEIERGEYNQVANYVYTQTEINIRIGKQAPNEYLKYMVEKQCNDSETKYGGITSLDKLKKNLLEDWIVVFQWKLLRWIILVIRNSWRNGVS